jgi:uncharacterized surface protein with fasciclin (FAS1) repeats
MRTVDLIDKLIDRVLKVRDDLAAAQVNAATLETRATQAEAKAADLQAQVDEVESRNPRLQELVDSLPAADSVPADGQ